MKNCIMLCILFFTVIGLGYSQVTLVKEELIQNRYRLTYRVDDSSVKFPVVLKNPSADQSESVRQVDESPVFQLQIALPANLRPVIRLSVSKVRENSVPQSKKNRQLNNWYTVKGYLWFGNYYCANIAVRPYELLSGDTFANEIEEFQIEFEGVNGSVASALHSDHSVPDPIENKRFAPQWKSAQQVRSTDVSGSWIDYNADYLKVGMVKDAIYRLDFLTLQAYGVPVGSLDPRSFKIYNKGKQIPIYVRGEQDLHFDSTDYVEFFGRRNFGNPRYREIAPYNTAHYDYLNLYSDTSVYWLQWSGGAGVRIDTLLQPNGTPTDTTRYYDQFLHAERDLFYAAVLEGGEVRMNFPEILENETWFEGFLGVGKATQNFTVSELYPNKPARAYAKVLSISSSVSTNAHNVSLSINSHATKYDSGFTNKYQNKVLRADFSSSLLINGTNSVNVNSSATSNTVNNLGRDWYELEYPRNLRTTNDSLDFGYRNVAAPYLSVIAVRGLSGASFVLYKYSVSDSTVVKITNYYKRNDTLYFMDTVRNDSRYFLLSSTKILKPLIFTKKKFKNLRNSSQQSDYIAITHPAFISLAGTYASFIGTTYNVTTTVVNVMDIYDEYNYGYFSPVPIRDFLRSTHEYWQQPYPKHVFLIGKGTYDYYGNVTKYQGVPKTINYIPPVGNPVSDTWFVQWDSTGSLIPQMNIGRLPSRNIDEFQSYFSKHQKFVSKGFDDWNKKYIFFSGGNITDANQIAQAKGVNDHIITNYITPSPIGGSISNFYKTPAPNVTNFGPYPPEYVKSSIDNGGVFISYIGHSGTQTWDNSITDVSQLANNRDRSPMMSDFGCSTGKFAEPDVFSFSELAVNNVRGQAISYIGNSSLGFTSTAYTFPQIFYRTLLIDTAASLGDIHRLAKISYMKQYGSSGSYGLFVKTNTLIGDPIVQLPIPTKPNISFTNSQVSIQPERPTDQQDSIIVNVLYANLGKVPNDSVDFSAKVEHQGSVILWKKIRRSIPKYQDSLVFSIPSKGKSGEYVITVLSDSSNQYDELYENDNTWQYTIFIANTKIKSVALSQTKNQSSGILQFLNPSIDPALSHFNVEVSLNHQFSPKTVYQTAYDTFSTSFTLDTSYLNKRVWIRSKYSDASSEGPTNSYVVGTKDNYLLSDSIAFSSVEKQQIKLMNHQLWLDTTRTIFSAISGGFNDGNTAVISRNGQNFIPENTARGFHVCIFDKTTYAFKWYFLFDIQSGLTVSTNFKNLLDTLGTDHLLMVSIANDVSSSGALFPAALKTSIKQYGSKYIDSVKIADSWTLIGWKGAVQGSVPERYSKRYSLGGPVLIDTTIVIPNVQGTFSTEHIGPVSSWKSIETKYLLPNGSTITLGVLGVKEDNSIDTVFQNIPIDTLLSISGIDAVQYPSIKLFGQLKAGTSSVSPSLSMAAVNFSMLPELGTNYQVFSLRHFENNLPTTSVGFGDTIVQGEKLTIKYRVYNAGKTTAKNIPVKLVSLWQNNSVEQIEASIIDSIPGDSYKEFNTVYSTSLGSGKRTLQLSIDPDTTIREIYKDNNFFTFPIIIKKSAGNPILPNLSITQNAVTMIPAEITDETDTARFSIVYSNTGSLVNDSISIQVKHFYQSGLISTTVVRRKYPVSYDTHSVKLPILKNAGQHQLSIDIDHNGLITESSESDNASEYFFTVATTDFKVLAPTPNSISSVSQIIFLNPTTAGVSSVIALDLDTLSSFTTIQSFSKPMQQFATTFPLSNLKKNKRYHWRVKVVGSTHDWTVGSFFSGDSSISAFGQIDTVSWKQNIYTRTAFTPDSGARIVDTRTVIKALSAGFSDGNTGSITVNGINVVTPILGSGHNVIVLDSASFSVSAQRRFNITAEPTEADSLIQFIAAVSTGAYVADVIVDEGANNLSTAARNALKSIGSAYIDQVSFRDSWAIIGRKGAAAGSVPEFYRAQSSGQAQTETTVVRVERSGTFETPLIGPFTSLSSLKIDQIVTAGSTIKVQFVGQSASKTFDTLLTSINQNTISLAGINTKQYRNGKLVFHLAVPSAARNLKRTSAAQSPSVKSWSMSAQPSTELAVSAQSSVINRNQVMEGEQIQFSGTVYNVSSTAAESVLVQLKTNAAGIDNILKQQYYAQIPAKDSALFSFTYDTRGKRGNHSFKFEIDPKDSLSEQSKTNNSVSMPYLVQADTLRPVLQVTFDGTNILNGDYVSQQPEIRIKFTDNNPAGLLASDTSNFRIRLNNQSVPFISGTAELLNSTSSGRADIRWTPTLSAGENIIQISAKDVSENYSDTILLYVNVASEFMIIDLFNLPNPFGNTTTFTFTLAGPREPDEVLIKIYTVAGRLIQELNTNGIIGFNKIPWDGRDKDGDQIGNGVYLYKVIVKEGNKQIEALSKLVRMR